LALLLLVLTVLLGMLLLGVLLLGAVLFLTLGLALALLLIHFVGHCVTLFQ